MRLAYAARPHQEQARFSLLANRSEFLSELLRHQLCVYQAAIENSNLMSRYFLNVVVCFVIIKVAVPIALRNARPCQSALRTVTRSAIAWDSPNQFRFALCGCAGLICGKRPCTFRGPFNDFPAATLAMRTICLRHNGRICAAWLERKRTPSVQSARSCGNLCFSRSLSSLKGRREPLRTRSRKATRAGRSLQRRIAELKKRLFLDAKNGARNSTDDSMARFGIIGSRKAARHFVTHKFDEVFHLRLHVGHFIAHIQDYFDTREIDSQFAGQVEYHFKPLEVGVRVQTGVPLGARRLEQTHAFVQTQSLRVQLVQIGDGADHIARFGFLFWAANHHRLLAFAILRREKRFRGADPRDQSC